MRALATGLLSAAFLTPGQPVWAEPAAMQPVWERQLVQPAHSLENRAAVTDDSGQLWVVGIRHPDARNNDKSADRGWIGVFGPNGESRWEHDFVLRQEDGGVREVDAFVPLNDSSIVVAGVGENGDATLSLVRRDGSVRLVRSLGRKRIAFMFKTANDELILGGRDERDLYAARVSLAGNLRWEHTVDRGGDDLFLGGVEDANTVLLLDNSGVREQFFMRDAKLSLSRLDADHDGRDSLLTLDGRGGVLLPSGKGFALLLDGGKTVQQQLHFVRIDSRMQVVSDTELATLRFALERARMARFGNGDFLVTVADAGQLQALRVDAKGRTVARWFSPAGRFYLHADVVGGDDLFVVATNVIESAGKVVKRSLSVSKYAARASP